MKMAFLFNIPGIYFFNSAPNDIIELAKNETLEYLLEEDEDGTISPSITTAIWGDNDTISSIDNIVRMVQCGGYLIERRPLNDDWRCLFDFDC